MILPYFTISEIAVVVKAKLLADGAAGAAFDAENHAMLVRLLSFNSWLCMRDDGTLWFRGYNQWSEEEGTPRVEKGLTSYAAAHVVVAHTVQKAAHIRSRFGGRAFLIDTGMLSTFWQGGRASAVEIRAGGKFTARYLDGQEEPLEEESPESAVKAN